MARITLLIISLFSIVISCSPAVKAPPAKETTLLEAPVPETSKPAWQAAWERTLAEARKERKIIIYGSGGTQTGRDDMVRAMKDRFGLEMEMTIARGAEISSRLQIERRAGLYLVDVYIGSSKRMVQTDKPTGSLDLLEPALILPEVLEPKSWWSGQLLWVDKERTILSHLLYHESVLLRNVELVGPGEIKSYRDLLSSKWKERIIMDDPSMGGSTSASVFALGDSVMGWDFVRQLAKQNPVIIRDRRLLVEWIARGKYPLAVGTPPEATVFLKAGAPMEQFSAEEGAAFATGAGSVALINKAPHPNAAKIFINWLLSKEGQTLYSQAYGSPSARLDTPKEMFDPRVVPKVTGKDVFTVNEEYVKKRIHFEEVRAKEIFSHLLK